MAIEILQQPSVVWPVDLDAEDDDSFGRTYAEQAQAYFERLKESPEYGVSTGKLEATYEDCLIYVLANFGHVDMKQLTPSVVRDAYGDNCWYIHTHKTPQKTLRLYMKVGNPLSEFGRQNQDLLPDNYTTRRVVCEWYGRDGGIVILYGPTPEDTRLWSFGCNHSMATRKRIGSCYNEYSCECGAKWTVDSSG
tara:strand:+ start:740 stop:1318 length:579 start_codon:yes stop_codon:yes gene_type:complete